MDSERDGGKPLQACEADTRLDARVRRVSLLWWAVAFVFSCLLNFLAEPVRDWPGDLVNYAVGSSAGAAWCQFLALRRRRRWRRAEAFWAGLGLAALGGCGSGLVAGLVCWPLIVAFHLDQIVAYQIGFDLEHYITLSVAWYFLCLMQVSAERRSQIEEKVARLRVLVFRAEDVALREQVRPERLSEYFMRLNVTLARRDQAEAEGLVLLLSDDLRATLSLRAGLAPETGGPAFVAPDGMDLAAVQRGEPASGEKFTTRIHLISVVFWGCIFLLLFTASVATYAGSSEFVKIYVLSALFILCVIGCVCCNILVIVWRVFDVEWSSFAGCMVLAVLYAVVAFGSACALNELSELCWGRADTVPNLTFVGLCYYFSFYIVWHCIYAYAQTLRREVAQRAVLAQAAEAAAAARNSMLRYQVRPHFLFNALNALYALIADRRWAAARAMTEALSAYVERAFAEDERELVPIGEQVQALQTYLTIEKMRFGERLRVRVDIPERLAYACAPSLILHPLIENAMKYAVAATAEPVEVEIAADRANDTLLLRVCDSGGDPEAPLAPGLGIGLRNVKARLAGHYGERGSLQCKRLTPKGFVAEIRLPLELACTAFAA